MFSRGIGRQQTKTTKRTKYTRTPPKTPQTQNAPENTPKNRIKDKLRNIRQANHKINETLICEACPDEVR